MWKGPLGPLSGVRAGTMNPHIAEAVVSEPPEEKGLGKVVNELSTGDPDLGSCLLLSSDRLGIWVDWWDIPAGSEGQAWGYVLV